MAYGPSGCVLVTRFGHPPNQSCFQLPTTKTFTTGKSVSLEVTFIGVRLDSKGYKSVFITKKFPFYYEIVL